MLDYATGRCPDFEGSHRNSPRTASAEITCVTAWSTLGSLLTLVKFRTTFEGTKVTQHGCWTPYEGYIGIHQDDERIWICVSA